jgi:6-phosphofructokinase
VTPPPLGLLTSGANCPGFDAASRAAVRFAHSTGAEVAGFRNGGRAVIEGASHADAAAFFA